MTTRDNTIRITVAAREAITWRPGAGVRAG